MDGHQLAKWVIFYLATRPVASNLDATGNQFLMIFENSWISATSLGMPLNSLTYRSVLPYFT